MIMMITHRINYYLSIAFNYTQTQFKPRPEERNKRQKDQHETLA